MNVEELRSTADFRRVNKQMRRRVVKLTFGNSVVHVTRAGGMFKARFAGGKDSTFGADSAQALQRLQRLPLMVAANVRFKACDIEADRRERALERALERAIAKADRRSGR